MTSGRRAFGLAAMAVTLASALPAQQEAVGRDSTRRADTTRARELAPLVVTGRHDDLIGLARTASEGRVGAADLRLRPLLREGELLETVPGMIVTQHSGDGKANQYFVRGFNLDHGTDFATWVDGIPLNMPSHAHGQGYTDLNFLIPELVEHLEYRLGVAHASLGDFGSAGSAEFHLARRLARPFATASVGAWGFRRLAGGGSVRAGAGDLLAAAEVKTYDGPWVVAQRLRKLSGVARYTWRRGPSEFSLVGMAYHNRWNASDQIPLRAVTAGRLDRFGQVDPTDGGRTERYSVSANWRRSGPAAVLEADLYVVRSALDLFSNFAYFLDDTTGGDQFSQRERRTVLGGALQRTGTVTAAGATHVVAAGLQVRGDLLRPVGLYRTAARASVGTVREDRVTEWGGGAWAEVTSRWRPWFRSVAGARADLYRFDVRSNIPVNSGRRTAGLVSPKGTLAFTPARTLELYLSGGLGFHSNDARGTTIRVDPATGAPADPVNPLVRSRGAELGLRAAPTPGWRATVVLWALGLDSELLFVGDAGITEPSAASRRRGITLSGSWRPLPSLALDADVSFARARFLGVEPGADRIPGAMERVIAAGATWSRPAGGAFGALRLRHFGSYPLTEDNAVRATPTTLVNAEAGWFLRSGLRLQVSVLNLLDSRASDIQYYYVSRLPGEPADGIADVHFHPVEPRQLRAGIAWGP